jgi:hypothetical protein
LDFCGEQFEILDDQVFTIGREADLCLDENPFLHRLFLRFEQRQGLWWLANVGSRMSATVADSDGLVQSWLSPGAETPLIFRCTVIRFTAGQTAYEIEALLDDPMFSGLAQETAGSGQTTRGSINLTPTQKQMILALAEPILKSGKTIASIPSSADAALRLGWTLTRFNRKLDNVCERFTSQGVRGLHGSAGKLATSRRARLVEYALAMRLVKTEDLPLLDEVIPDRRTVDLDSTGGER